MAQIMLFTEPLGITNSARAVNGKTISIKKLMSMVGLDGLHEHIKYGAESNTIEREAEIIAEMVLNVMIVANNWQKDGYQIID